MATPPPSPNGREWRRVLLEAGLVGVAGLAFALAANAVSSRGIKLTRNYFAALEAPARPPVAIPTNQTNAAQPVAPATNLAVAEPLTPLLAKAAERLRQRGLQMATWQQARQLFHDARYAKGEVVFVDARNDRHYQDGHIPGAWSWDPYRHENYLAEVLPVCQRAEIVMVYCTGGDCEDSEMAAVQLVEAGIPRERLLVFAGGFEEWSAHQLPVEKGPRRPPQRQGPASP